MVDVPKTIAGAEVFFFTPIDHRQRPTGNCHHFVSGELQGPAFALAICRYDESSGYYLFGLDPEGQVVTDSLCDTIAQAMFQAEFEYEGVSKTWMRPAVD